MAITDFPPLRLAVLNGLIHLKERRAIDPDILRSDGCPYDPETVELLEKLLEVVEVERVVEKHVVVDKRDRGRPKKFDGMTAEDLAELDKEVKSLLESLKGLNELGTGLETNERVQILKTKASLIEQALKNRERILNLKSMSEFQTVVIGILDELIDESGRDAFLERIEPYRD